MVPPRSYSRLNVWFTRLPHSAMLQLVGYGTSLVRNTKLRVLAREREQTQQRRLLMRLFRQNLTAAIGCT